ncbi:ABC transporter substrate-binding protein [Acinetobacter ihumii]|uniref:ABC transporter substrate-binding protein n=1 Tax=Acinetobacter ihumii TaxID=2483802 RepID=UPI00102FD2A9|nr:ABC transporter substrate-binding protein [Acinetobacter ihumii]
MAHLGHHRRYIWALPSIIVIIFLFIIFKPSSPSSHTRLATSDDTKLVRIRVAVPDLGATERHSSGTPLVDYIYVNKLLEKQFAAQNIQVEWQFFKGAGPAINEALVNRQIDVAFLGDLAAIIGKANNTDTTLLAATGRNVQAYLGVLPNQGYDSLEKLKGKRIGLFQGTAMQLSFDQFIDQYGYTEKDFRIVNLDSSAANAALAAKQIDASWGLTPILALKQQGIIDVPVSTQDRQDGAGTIQAGLIARSQFVQQHPEAVQQFVNVVLQSAHWASQPEHREQAIALVTQNAGYPEQLFRLSLEHVDLKNMYSPILDDHYLNHLQAGVNTALKTKLIKQGFEVKQWGNSKFVDEGIKQLSYENFWK